MVDTSTEAVTKLLDGVTAEPWTEHDAGKHPYVFVCGPEQLYYNGDVKDKSLVAYVTGSHAIQNRSFIAASRDLVPALLAERDALAAAKWAAEADVARRLEMHECAMAERDDCIEDWSKANDRIKALEGALRDVLDGENWRAGKKFDPNSSNFDLSKQRAALAASRAASDCQQRDLVTAEAAQPITVQDAAETDAERFDRADWFWRVMDPDDSADTPAEAIHRGMIGDYCVCEIASSYTGPVRFGFNAPVLDPESDDTEFSHFATQQEAIDAAKARSAALRAIAEGRE